VDSCGGSHEQKGDSEKVTCIVNALLLNICPKSAGFEYCLCEVTGQVLRHQ